MAAEKLYESVILIGKNAMKTLLLRTSVIMEKV